MRYNRNSNGFDQPDYDFQKYIYGDGIDTDKTDGVDFNAGNGSVNVGNNSAKIGNTFTKFVNFKHNYIVLIALEIILAVAAVVMFNEANTMKKYCTEVTTGEVISIVKRSHLEKGNKYVPKVKFTVDGKEYVIKGKKYNRVYGYFTRGEQMDVKYDPNDPTTCYLVRDGISYRWVSWLVAALLGLLPTVGAVKKAIDDGRLILSR